MTEDEMKKKAIAMVQEVKPDAMGLRASLVDDFFEGVVALVDYAENGVKGRNYVYFDPDNRGTLSQSTEAFIKSFSGRRLRYSTQHSVNIIAGAIAILITLTICYLVLSNAGKVEVPQVLSGALTLILGFYFGSTTKGDKAK